MADPRRYTWTFAYDAQGRTFDGTLQASESLASPVTCSVSRTDDTDFRVAAESANSANTAAFGCEPDSEAQSAAEGGYCRWRDR